MNLSSKRAWLLAAASAALIAAFLLYPEHRQHLFGLIPYAFLFACPLLHLETEHILIKAQRTVQVRNCQVYCPKLRGGMQTGRFCGWGAGCCCLH